VRLKHDRNVHHAPFDLYRAATHCGGPDCSTLRAVESIGVPLTQGAHVFFKRLNAAGGIHGRKVLLLDCDDRFDPKQTLAHAEELVTKHNVVALINTVGAATNKELAASGFLARHGVAMVGAFTAATSVRALASPNLYFLRPSIKDEVTKMVQQVRTMSIRTIAVVHQTDSFAEDARSLVAQILNASPAASLVSHSFDPAKLDVDALVEPLKRSAPQVIFFFGTGVAAAKFLVAYRKAGGGAMFIVSSSTAPDVLIRNAGEYATAAGIAQVMPPLTKKTVPIVHEYHEALKEVVDCLPLRPRGLLGRQSSHSGAQAGRRMDRCGSLEKP